MCGLLEAWSVCLLQIGSFCTICRTDSCLISKYFQHFLKKNKNQCQAGPKWESQARTASYLCNKLGRPPHGKSPEKLSCPTDCQQVAWQQCNPSPGFLKDLNVRTAGLHLACSPIRQHCWYNHTILHPGWVDNPCNQNIIISAEWAIVHRQYARSREQTHTRRKMSTNKCSDRPHTFSNSHIIHMKTHTRSQIRLLLLSKYGRRLAQKRVRGSEGREKKIATANPLSQKNRKCFSPAPDREASVDRGTPDAFFSLCQFPSYFPFFLLPSFPSLCTIMFDLFSVTI